MTMIGGIAAENSGQISDCYTIWNKRLNKENQSLIAKNSGTVATSLLVHDGECKGVYDGSGNFQPEYVIQKTSDLKNLGFDTRQCWEYVGDSSLLRFQSQHWHSADKSFGQKMIVTIKTVEQYVTFAEKVNSGEPGFLTAKVRLESDLNFRGQNIPIIGIRKECAFSGVFDGQGHLIWNGTIRNEEAVYAGLFGYMKGVVLNLIFDGRIHGERNLGGLCGYNYGTIDCCGAVIRTWTKGDRYHIGGLAVQNTGTIKRSYAVFEPRRVISPIIPMMLTAMFFICMGTLGYCTILKAMETGKEYATIEVDPGQEKVETPDGPEVVKNGSNSISFTFNQTVVISKSAGTCKLDFINPTSDSNKIVVELQVEDIAGERITVAQSKAILPGYQLEALTLNEAADEFLAEEPEEGYVVLVPYDSKTESKGVVQTELPVKMVYGN